MVGASSLTRRKERPGVSRQISFESPNVAVTPGADRSISPRMAPSWERRKERNHKTIVFCECLRLTHRNITRRKDGDGNRERRGKKRKTNLGEFLISEFRSLQHKPSLLPCLDSSSLFLEETFFLLLALGEEGRSRGCLAR